jgi:hypothetical protein
MSDEIQGVLEIQDAGGTATHIELSGDNGEIDVGGAGASGSVILQDSQGRPRIRIGHTFLVKGSSLTPVWEISVLDSSGTKIVELGPSGNLYLGAQGTGGDLSVRGQTGKDRIRIHGDDGSIELRDDQNTVRVDLDAEGGVSVQQSGQSRAGYFVVDASKNTGPALEGRHKEAGAGVTGTSKDADGVYGASAGTYKSGVYGSTSELTGYGVSGRNTNFNDCFGALGARPVLPGETTPCAVYGWASNVTEEGGSIGVLGKGDPFPCVGVQAESDHYVALSAECLDSIQNPDQPYLYAGLFQGNVGVAGELWAYAKNCKIDHPLDPANKYLVHACVESSERLNVYRGSATLNSKGEATVRLPNWAEAFNSEFEYQLTPIGGSAPDLHIGDELKDSRFRIAGGKPRQRVSWQVTGVRSDAYARAHPLRVEMPKRAADRGKYLTPIEHRKSEKQRMRLREITPTRRRISTRSRPPL